MHDDNKTTELVFFFFCCEPESHFFFPKNNVLLFFLNHEDSKVLVSLRSIKKVQTAHFPTIAFHSETETHKVVRRINIGLPFDAQREQRTGSVGGFVVVVVVVALAADT